MIAATQEGKHCFLVKLDIPDVIVIQEIALGLGMKTTDVIVACINKGIYHYADMLKEIAAHETRKRNDKNTGTHNNTNYEGG